MSSRMAAWDINPQSQSVLYDGTIPTEIRLMIFDFAMEEFTVQRNPVYPLGLPGLLANHDFHIEHDHDDNIDPNTLEYYMVPETNGAVSTDEAIELHKTSSLQWFRPGYTGLKRVTVGLLQTCRRTYLETRDLPMQNKEMCAWIRNGPISDQRMESIFTQQQLTGYQLNRVRSLHIFVYMHYLETSLYVMAADPRKIFRRIEHLKLTVRKSDWQLYSDESTPVLYPYDCRTKWEMQHLMDQAMEETKDYNKPHANTNGSDGSSTLSDMPSLPTQEEDCRRPAWMPPIDFNMRWKFHRPWGMAFGHFPNLKTLTMEFDTDEGHKQKLESIVEWAARVWRFPLDPKQHGYHYLSADGNPIQRARWRGTPNLWDRGCQTPFCTGQVHVFRLFDAHGDGGRCRDCHRKREMILAGLGPMMYTWTVTWTARKFEGKSFYEYFPDDKLKNNDLGDCMWPEED